MANFIRVGKKFPGVYYRPLKKSVSGDKTFFISYRSKTTGKQIMEKVGRASEGMSPEKARLIRLQRIEDSIERKFDRKKAPRLEIVFEKYLAVAKKEKKSWKSDSSTYRNYLERPFGHLRLDVITPSQINELKQRLLDQGLAPRTVNKALQLLRHLFNWAKQNELYNGDNPVTKVRFLTLNNARTRFLTPIEAQELLTALKKRSLQTYHIAAFSLLTGMRLGEILDLKWDDINLEEKLILVRDPKNGESRQIPISERLEQIIQERAEAVSPLVVSPYVFCQKDGRKIPCLSKSFYRTVKALGFNDGVTDPRQRVSFHTLRHTYASWAVKAGIPLYNLAKALGHKTFAMTQRYSHLAPDTLQPIVNTVSQIVMEITEGTEGA